MTRRRWLGGVITAGLALGAPAMASAAVTYCVPNTTIAGCPAGASAEATVAAALSASAVSGPGPNTIRIGPGTFSEGPLDDALGNRVAIIGAGPGATTLSAPGGGSATLELREPASSVSALSILAPAGVAGAGIEIWGDPARAPGPTLQNLGVSAPPAAAGATGILTHSGAPSLSRLSVAVPAPGVGVSTDAGALASVADSSLSGATALLGPAYVTRSRLAATVDVSLADAGGGAVTVDSSVLRTTPGSGAETAVNAPATNGAGVSDASVFLRHDTLLGDGSPNSTGVVCSADATGANTAASCSTAIDSSIILGFERPLARAATAGSSAGAEGAADVTIDYSDLDPSGDSSVNTPGAGGQSATGTITLGSHDLNVAPSFASSDPASPSAWALTRQSPLIDAGDPALGSLQPSLPESTTDLYGQPRVVAGTRGASAVSDVGATEYQALVPTITAAVASPRVPARTQVQFVATAFDADPGDSVTVSWRFDDGGTASGAVAAHAFVHAGAHRATATATDLDGNSATATVVVSVLPAKPVLAHLSLKPRSFLAARHGGSLAPRSGRGGTLIAYTDTQSATASLVILAPAAGVVAGRACQAPPRHGSAHGRRCTRWVRVGAFTHRDRAGRTVIRFTGRVGGRSLAAGQYRLSLSARNAGGVSTAIQAVFSVRR